MNYSNDLQKVFDHALEYAKGCENNIILLEHISIALLRNSKTVIEMIDYYQIDRATVVSHLRLSIERELPKVASVSIRDIQQSIGVSTALRYAKTRCVRLNKKEIDALDLLVSMFSVPASYVTTAFRSVGLTNAKVAAYIELEANRGKKMGSEDEDEDIDVRGAIKAYTENLTQKAKAGKIEPLVGRKDEIQRIINVLSRKKKNNPIIVGESGVGKTALIEGLALAIAEMRVPESILDTQVLSLDVGALISGTKFRGEFEARLKSIISEVQGSGNCIIFIDEIHNIVGMGATSGGTLDASNILKPALASGDLRCIGSTTFKEYKDSFEKDKALSRRFQKVEIKEPGAMETVEILSGIKKGYENHHKVSYSAKILKSIVDLAGRYINDRFFPDKAIDILDEVGASLRVNSKHNRVIKVKIKDVESVVSRIARVSVKASSASDTKKLYNLEGILKSSIFGQDQAIETVASAIKLSRAGLGSSVRPIGNFLFSGPTGVGKTELAKQLSNTLGMHLVRFDMSEYMEKHSVSRLIGAPPGYIGFDQGGILIDEIIKHPSSIILLDEIEKAHPDLFNVLLQIMDYATLTDNTGRKADFRNSVIIMTTNAGAFEISKKSVGFGDAAVSVGGKEVIERTFSPEFRNRLDAWIPFNRLDRSVIGQVANKCICELKAQLLKKRVKINFDSSAIEWIVNNGYDEKNGARPMERLVDRKVRRKIADEILFGGLKKGGSVEICCDDGDLRVNVLDNDVVKLEESVA